MLFYLFEEAPPFTYLWSYNNSSVWPVLWNRAGIGNLVAPPLDNPSMSVIHID
jgi:hypothetical protein